MTKKDTLTRISEALAADRTLKRATAYETENHVIKLTRQRPHDARSRSHTYLLTFGKPNYEQSQFIKACKKAGEKFPIAKLQLQHWPKPRKAAKK